MMPHVAISGYPLAVVPVGIPVASNYRSGNVASSMPMIVAPSYVTHKTMYGEDLIIQMPGAFVPLPVHGVIMRK